MLVVGYRCDHCGRGMQALSEPLVLCRPRRPEGARASRPRGL